MPDFTPTNHASAGPQEAGESRPAQPALDNNAKSSGNRTNRWMARGFNWNFSKLNRCRKCGRVTVTADGSVGVRANGESVGFAGLSTCGSVWACAVCNSRIQSVRRLEVGVALANVHANGGGAAFGAITVRHHAGQRLDGLLAALGYGIARIGQDKRVKALRLDMGYLGRIQALEVTHGSNGWHPHRHPLPVFSVPPDPDKLIQLHMAEFRAFSAGVTHQGYDSPLDIAQILTPVTPGTAETLGDYFAKSVYSHDAAAWEVTSSQTKNGRQGSRTPWQLLDSARIAGDMDDLDLWNEYEEATKGKRALTFSRGLRDLVGLGKEASDEDIADAEVGDKEDTGFRVLDWSPVAARPELGAGLLNAVTPAGNWQAGREYARKNGIQIGDNDV